MISYTCISCQIQKPLDCFHKWSKGKFGHKITCKDCRKIEYKNNKDHILQKRKERYALNKDKAKLYDKNNRDKINAAKRSRIKTNINFKLTERLRVRLYCAIRNNQKVGSAVNDLGCTVEELKIYLESKFQPGMTWDNWSYYGWHIDHIVPLSSFDLSNREEFLKANHYSNLQPLWATDNRQKTDKLIKSRTI